MEVFNREGYRNVNYQVFVDNPPAWNPSKQECGEGKFHGCAFPHWCDNFRAKNNDRYIAIGVKEEDFYEWKKNPNYPQKIGFRKGIVLYEVDRGGNKIQPPAWLHDTFATVGS